MSARTKAELLENSSVKLKVTIPKADVKSEYDGLVDEYSRNVQIKGFRPGKVPSEVLIRKFGDSLKSETLQKLIEDSLKAAFEKVEHKPLPYSMPELRDEVDLDLEKALSFEVFYDTFPVIELGEYKNLEVTESIVKVEDEDVDRELAAIQDQNAIVVDKQSGEVEKDDTVTVDYVEVGENDQEIDATKREGFTFSVGSGYNLHKIDDDVVGMKKDEEKILVKEYPDDFENSELAGRKIRLQVKVTGVKEKKLPDIDDELAQDVSDRYETLDDLKNDIRKRLEETIETRIREGKILQILKKTVESSQVPLPASMTEQELASRWRSFVQQFRADEDTVLRLLQEQEKTKENLLDEWRPGVEEALKMRLVENRIVEELKPEVTDEEVDNAIRQEAEGRDKEYEEVKEEYGKNNLMEYLKSSIETRKAHEELLALSKVKKGKKVKLLDFLQAKD